MKIKFGAWFLSAAAVLIGSTMTPAMADEWNKETRLEINEPLEIPGRVLSPGTYIFKLLDSNSDQNVVEVFSEDSSGNQKFVTTVLTISAYKTETPDKPIIALEERAAGSPQAIRSWFYPGDNFGREFVYPKVEHVEVSANPASAAEPAPTPAVAPAPPEPSPEVLVLQTEVEEPVVEQEVREQSDAPSFVEVAEVQESVLPETAGYSVIELAAGATMLALGLLAALVGLRRAQA
jgi:hypothetical protein